jgi:lysophospholipid acyltransferase (LPLAT)-like uncharacterized protein
LHIINQTARLFLFVMQEKNAEVYRQAALTEYSFKQRAVIRLADWTFYLLIKLIGATVRFEIEGSENLEKIEADGRIPIYTFWHNRIFLATYFFRNRGIVVMSSPSFDAEYIKRFIRRFGYGAVRGSSTRGGVGALVKMIRLMRDGLPAGFSIDGPRGPKYVAKSGACMLAKKTGNPVMPFIVEAEKYWEIGSWDQLQIPKPFSRAKVIIAEPIYVRSDDDDEEIENKRALLQTKLDELVSFGEQWRENII